jgi:hypothetical protein
MQQLHSLNVKYVSAHQTQFKAPGHKFRPPKNTVGLQKNIPNDMNIYFTLLIQQ